MRRVFVFRLLAEHCYAFNWVIIGHNESCGRVFRAIEAKQIIERSV